MSYEFFTLIYIFITTLLFYNDCRYLTLPLSLTSTLIFFGTLFSVFQGTMLTHLCALVIGSSIFLCIYAVTLKWYKKEVLGIGDIFLVAGIGMFWGTEHILLTIYLSFIISGIISILLVAISIKSTHDYIAFGPFLIVSSWLLLSPLSSYILQIL